MVSVAVMMVITRMMVMGLSSHINDDSRYSQDRRIFVLDKLTDILCDDEEEQDKPDNNKYLHFNAPLLQAERASRSGEAIVICIILPTIRRTDGLDPSALSF